MSLDALEANLLECDRPFVKVYGVITLLLLAWKSSTFTYIRWAVVWEVTAVLLLWFLNFLRHFFARAATSIRKDPNTVEYYVLWIDKALARTGAILLMLHIAIFFLRFPITPSNFMSIIPMFVASIVIYL
eukprot:GEMP01099980.1.p1 GENE.GEMP01099980.1~~GEMP01099980.1.p1  ORF type:complete len:151 (+),score=12.25 GEMP01099980.1:64-453(+)